jgi:hypothetical protein
MILPKQHNNKIRSEARGGNAMIGGKMQVPEGYKRGRVL